MKDERFRKLEAELRRQAAERVGIEAALAAWGDGDLAVPSAFFDELEAITTLTNNDSTAIPSFGIRG